MRLLTKLLLRKSARSAGFKEKFPADRADQRRKMNFEYHENIFNPVAFTDFQP